MEQKKSDKARERRRSGVQTGMVWIHLFFALMSHILLIRSFFVISSIFLNLYIHYTYAYNEVNRNANSEEKQKKAHIYTAYTLDYREGVRHRHLHSSKYAYAHSCSFSFSFFASSLSRSHSIYLVRLLSFVKANQQQEKQKNGKINDDRSNEKIERTNSERMKWRKKFTSTNTHTITHLLFDSNVTFLEPQWPIIYTLYFAFVCSQSVSMGIYTV